MCGIAGIFNYKNTRPVTMESLKTMNRELVHRGPDDEGFYIGGNIGLAFRRLSIIDLDTGNQPIHNEDKSIWVVFNGEIYNYVELKETLEKQGHSFYTRSDTEVIVHLYEEYGADFPLALNGMYAIALWDDHAKTLLLIRDRPGIKPLYYAETADGLMFASEIKALLSGGVGRVPDYEAVSQYLSYGYVPSPLTGFSAIRKLDAGHMLICSNKGCHKKEYWDMPNISFSKETLSEDELTGLFIDELKMVMHRQTRSDVPVGIFLSGGIDSSLIASVAAEKCNLKLNAFTVGFEETSYNELDKAKIVAGRLGLSLHEVILSERDIIGEIENIMSFLDEPLFDYSAIPVYFVSKLARSMVKTVVGGEGGDELFGGYQTHYLYKVSEWYRRIPQSLRNGIKGAVDRLPESHNYLSMPYKLKRFTYGAEYAYDEGHYRWKVLFDAEEKAKLLNPDFVNKLTDLESFYAMENHFKKAAEKGYGIQDQLMYVDFKTFLQDDPLQKTDKMSMANSLEVRVPLLDNAIIDFSRKVPLNKKIKGVQTKYLLRKALAKFQPHDIAFGKKRGFTPPMAMWIKNGLKDYMLTSLSRESLSKLEFLNHDYVKSIISDHLEGRAENSRLIWALIALVNWHRNYVFK
ncbi:MAG: asparagine synthase (glutamine-hydrolyzing) [Nitrospirae bacterium]|nr:asparagine synthase (glutamine-hydrolyzing) [Nitrospirota bacterium]